MGVINVAGCGFRRRRVKDRIDQVPGWNEQQVKMRQGVPRAGECVHPKSLRVGETGDVARQEGRRSAGKHVHMMRTPQEIEVSKHRAR